MIAMRMCKDHQINARNSGAPEIRDDDPFRAALGGRFAVDETSALEPAAGVDENRPSVRRSDDDAVSLADVEHRYREGRRRAHIRRQCDTRARQADHHCRDNGSAPQHDRRADDGNVIQHDRPERWWRYRRSRSGQRCDMVRYAQDQRY